MKAEMLKIERTQKLSGQGLKVKAETLPPTPNGTGNRPQRTQRTQRTSTRTQSYGATRKSKSGNRWEGGGRVLGGTANLAVLGGNLPPRSSDSRVTELVGLARKADCWRTCRPPERAGGTFHPIIQMKSLRKAIRPVLKTGLNSKQ